jgi:hypothetical protein
MKLTDKEVLEKAIEIAIENGYKEPMNTVDVSEDDYKFTILIWKVPWFTMGDFFKTEEVIFSHDFAKAFWGITQTSIVNYDDAIMERPYSFELGFTWQRHLMKMVIEPNPIDYLRKFINTENS